MSEPTELNLSDRRTPPVFRRRGGVDWKTVAAVIAAVVALLAWFGFSPHATSDQIKAATDQLNALTTRMSVIEVDRANDLQRLQRVEEAEQRIEDKEDTILERLAK